MVASRLSFCLSLLWLSSGQDSCSPIESFDRGLNDIDTIPFDNSTMHTPQQCCAACNANAQCTAWTMVAPPGPRTGCHLKFPTPPPNPVEPPCAPYCVSGHRPYPPPPYEDNTDRPGGDMGGSNLVDGPGACAQMCANTKRCIAWSFAGPGWSRPGCYLKDQLSGPSHTDCNNSCTSGVLPPYTPAAPFGRPHAVGYDRGGFDYKAFIADGPDACALACSSDSSCVSWTYVETDPYIGCHLKNSLPPLTQTCARCTSSGPPAACNGDVCSKPVVPSQTCGAWIMWRYVQGWSFVHQAFGYDNSYQPSSKGNPQVTSGYGGCGYNVANVSVCYDCGSSKKNNASAFSFANSAGGGSADYCLGLVCQGPATGYQFLLSSDGLGTLYPDESKYICWFLDPTKAQYLDCATLAAAEMSMRAQWNYCQNPNAPNYVLTTHNCRYYVLGVMQAYCRSRPTDTACKCISEPVV